MFSRYLNCNIVLVFNLFFLLVVLRVIIIGVFVVSIIYLFYISKYIYVYNLVKEVKFNFGFLCFYVSGYIVDFFNKRYDILLV